MSIKRWQYYRGKLVEHMGGKSTAYVLEADHLAALRAQEAQPSEDAIRVALKEIEDAVMLAYRRSAPRPGTTDEAEAYDYAFRKAFRLIRDASPLDAALTTKAPAQVTEERCGVCGRDREFYLHTDKASAINRHPYTPATKED